MNAAADISLGETQRLPMPDGAELSYIDQGTGPPIVLLHGVWGSMRFFHQQIAPLSVGHRVVAVDFRGHGSSAMTLDRQTVSAYAQDLKHIIEALGLDQPVLVGWSMGAVVIWEYFRHFGQAGIRGAVVVDQAPTDFRSETNPGGIVGLDELGVWHREVLMNQTAFMRIVAPMMFHRPLPEADFAWVHAEMCAAPAVIAAAIFVDQCLQDYRDVIENCPVPTMVCAGENSMQPRAAMEWIAQSVTHGEFRLFANCGHCLFLEEPELFNAAVLDYVARLAAP